MVFIRNAELDSFAAMLRQYGEEKLSNIKSNWHISMHCGDVEMVQEQVERWTVDRDVWGIYINRWNKVTSTSKWFKIEEE